MSSMSSYVGTTGSSRGLTQDLLVAADSVTNAMSSLVKELNSGKLMYALISKNPSRVSLCMHSYQRTHLM